MRRLIKSRSLFFPRNALLRTGGAGLFNASFIPSLGKDNVSHLSFFVHFENLGAKLRTTAAPYATIFIKVNCPAHVILLYLGARLPGRIVKASFQ
jgi:hypothetical protein